MSNESRGKLALKAGTGYTIGNILIKGLSFLSIPVFARLLTVSDYGIYNTFGAYVSIIGIIIGLALNTSIKNANIDFHTNIKEYESSITILVLINSAIWILISIVISVFAPELFDLSPSYLLFFVVVESLAMSMITYYNGILAVNYKFKEYLFISLVYSVVGIGLSVVLCVTIFNENRYMGRIIGTLGSASIICVYIFMQLYKNAKPKIIGEYWIYALKISIPIIPHGLSQVLLSQFDRLMINNISGAADAGLYSFAYNIGAIFQIITNSLDTSWTQWFFDKMTLGHNKEIRRISNYYAIIISIGAIALLLISPEVITILGGGKYDDSKPVALPIVLAMYFSFLYNFSASIEYYYKKTIYIGAGTLFAAILNIILNLIFIPKCGYVAAAYTTVFCYFIYYVLHTAIANIVIKCKVYDIKLQFSLVTIVSVFMIISLIFLTRVIVRYILLTIIIIAGSGLCFYRRELIINKIREFRN